MSQATNSDNVIFSVLITLISRSNISQQKLKFRASVAKQEFVKVIIGSVQKIVLAEFDKNEINISELREDIGLLRADIASLRVAKSKKTQNNNTQLTLSSTQATAEAKKQLIEDLIEVFATADIPLKK
ncbi:12841_t:CDS:2, partial [Funneliformis geosporum]